VVAAAVGAVVGAAVGAAVAVGFGVGVAIAPSSGIVSPSSTLPSSAIENTQ